jgi:hypothetical protein
MQGGLVETDEFFELIVTPPNPAPNGARINKVFS